MKTIDIEIAVMKYFGVRRHIIVPNVYWGIGIDYECDLVVLTNSGYATEIEIKVSKGDLLKDKNKKHNHDSNYFKYLYFAVPKRLEEVALANIPERAGLLVVENKKIRTFTNEFYKIETDEIKKPTKNKQAHKWDFKERLNLTRLGTMRILGLKEKIRQKMYNY